MKETKCIITDGCMKMVFDGKKIVVGSNKPTTNFSVGEFKCNLNAEDTIKEMELLKRSERNAY